jgi:outer membrane protein assembly factor BamB
MKKKTLRITLIVACILFLVIAGFGLYIYNFTQGSEKLLGKREAIPQKTMSLDSIITGTSDWPNWHGQNYDKKSNFTGLKTDWSNGLTKKWEVNFLCQGDQTASWSAAVIQGNVLVVPGRDEKNDLVFCLNAESGEIIWKGSYEVETKTNHGPGARATPSIDGDRIYTFGRSGDMVCWNLIDGKKLWHKKVGDIGGIEPEWGYSSSPLVYGKYVIVQAGGKAVAVAFDKFSGEVIWTSGNGSSGYAPVTFMKADSSILLFSGEALSGVNKETGAINWTLPWVVDYKMNASLPVSEANIVFVTSGYGKGCMAVKVEANKATVLWESKAIEGMHSDPVIVNGYVYGYSGNSSSNRGNLVCLRLSDGKVMWKSAQAGNGTFAYADGKLICFDIKGNLYLVEANPEKFVKSGEFKKAMPYVKNPAWTAPVIANGKLYLRYLQNLICYDVS